MIRRAASRTSSERPSSTSLRPSISAFSLSRVRSDAGILSIGVLLRQTPERQLGRRGFRHQATVHPDPFSSKFRTSPGPMTGAAFRAYVEQMLAPSLCAGDVIVMDNLAAH